MSKSTPISVSRVRFVPLTIVTIFSVLCLALIFTLSSTAAGVLIAGWGFEGVSTTNTGQTPTVSVGSATADSGALTSGSAFTGFHASAATAWSNPAGNASIKSVSSNNWSVGDYYQFSLSTSGYNAINITWDQTGSATGPRDFKVQYSTNGSTFTDATAYSLTNPAIAWSTTGSPNLPSRRTLDLSSVTALDNQSTIYIRIVDNSTTAIQGTTVASGGTGRVDNFTVSGTAVTGTFTLGVTRNGTGTGTVTSSPAGINCGATCSASYNSSTSVTLTATADVNSTFTSWSGCDSVSANTCTVAMTANRNVTATFTSSLRTLTVSRNGTGTGTVTSSPAGINCGATCSAAYNVGTVVTLTATPDVNSTFTSWTGCDSTSGNQCTVTMSATRTVTATFTSSLRTLTVSRTGTGTGTVTSSPAGINCGATCSATYADGTVVNLTATAGANSTFNGWSGACTGSGACAITMDADKSATANFIVTPPPANDVVISQVYGGGGNTGATLTNDYIELINHSSSPVNLSGWSVQAFVSTTGTWQVTPLTNFNLLPGQYYLIQESQGAGGTDPLPTPDATGTIPVSSTSTKVALVNNTTTITAACPNAGAAGIVDLVGYGPTDCFEGSGTAPGLSNTTADFRLNGGCFDTNDNSVDFVTGAPNPHNSSSATHDCTGLSATGSANPSTVLQGNSTILTVNVAPAQNPASSGLTVTADLSLIGGSASQPFSGSGTTFTFAATVPANNPSGMKSLPVTIADGQGRTANTNILVSVLSTTPEHVTISQVYGGGGNTGATYENDYVELYNPTAAPISMTGWSLQYGAATGTTFSGKQVLGGTIDPGHYYLVSLASGGAVGAPLPPASVTGTDINMAAAAGKIVLVSNSDTLSGACPLGTDPDIVDFVGYGTTANCHEGTANAPAPSNTTAIFRKTGGGTDSDQNGNDFVTGAPNPRSTTPVVEFGPSVAGTDPATNATIAPYDSSITVDFSEPVDAVGAWYNITCTVTGLHNDATVAHTNDFKTWAFTPNTSFQFGEQCTVTINKNQIHDQDTDDSGPNTDTLSADYVWSFTVVGAGQPAPYPPSVHLTMGNPSNATAFVSDFDNYLMQKPTYSLSYNRDKGTPNWVSWHLDSSWYGTLARVDTFRPDPAVDPTWYRVQAFDYSGTGFDRGHMTPNADRDNQNRIPINQETYLMSNMVPQAPDNNQGPWANLEGDLRTIADGGNELYIISGPLGVGGIGSANGNTVNTIANGHVTVPAYTWKVALVLPSGSGDDVSRVTCSTRTIAVLMPNTQGIRNTPWQSFLTTVDAIEQATGYDLYSNLPPAVQACVEAGTNGVNPPGTANQSATTQEYTPVTITLQALRSNSNTLAFSVVNGPTHGSLGSIGATSCTGGSCTATVSYTPGPNYNGPDSFTFRASDGSINSNTSTVSITVTKATATINVSGYTGVYDGNAHGATGSATGVNGEDLTSLLDFGASFTDVSGGTAHWTFAGNENYLPSSGDATITITKAPSTTTVTCPASQTYTGSAIEPCTASYSGAGVFSGSLTPIYANNINAGSATASASFGGDANHDGSTGNGGFTITKASSTTTVTCPASATYTGSAIEPCTASYSGAGGLSGSLMPIYANNINAGSATATATYGGDANHDGSIGNGGFTITKASSTTTVTCSASETYTGSGIEPCSATVTGAGGLNQSVPVVYANNVNAGPATATATYGGDANHDGSTGSSGFTITKASSTTTVACPTSEIYTGAALTPCSATVTGANLSLSPAANYANNTNVGTATASYAYTGDPNHTASGDSKNFEIMKASSTTTVNCPASETYTGSAQTPCTASYSGVGGLAGSLTPIYLNNTNVGTAGANATYDGDANHTGSTGSGSFEISKASSSTTVSVSNATFDGNPHGGTATATGVGGLNQTLTVTYIGRNLTNYGPSTTEPTDAGDYTASASFPGDDNHTDSADSRDFTINRAASTTTVTCTSGPFVYSGSPITPCSASTTGAGALTQTLAVSYADNVNAGNATASASFGGDQNHTASSDSTNFAIAKANQLIMFGALNDTTFGAANFTINVTSSSGLIVSLAVTSGPCTLDSATSPANVHITGAGTCIITGTQSGNSNYNSATDVSRSFNIAKANQTISFNALPNKTFGDPNFNVSASGGGSGNPITFTAIGNCTVSGNTVHITGAGPCTVVAAQNGDTNYNPAADVSQTFSIAKAPSTTTVNCPASMTYAGVALTPCSVTVTGASLSLTPSASYTNNINVGTATAGYTYAGDSNHVGSSDSRNFQITKANANITITPYNVAYDGNPHTATGTAKGAQNETLSGLNLGGTTHTNAGSYATDPWTFTDVTGNYNNAGGTVADSIGKATPLFSNLSAPTIDGNTTSVTLSGKLTLGSLVPTGSVAITLNGVTHNAVIQPNGSFTSDFSTGSLIPANSPYAVTFAYAGDAYFNPANAGSTLTIKAPRKVKQDVLAALVVLRAAATDKKDKDELDDAIDHLNKALTPSFWIDDSHPTENDGEKVFNEEKTVVKELAELIKNKQSMNPTDAALMDLIARLVQADREMALISISEETDPQKVAKGMDEIAKGDAERDKDKPDHADNAIDHYKKAWKKT